jgi:hypothetical protein
MKTEWLPSAALRDKLRTSGDQENKPTQAQLVLAHPHRRDIRRHVRALQAQLQIFEPYLYPLSEGSRPLRLWDLSAGNIRTTKVVHPEGFLVQVDRFPGPDPQVEWRRMSEGAGLPGLLHGNTASVCYHWGCGAETVFTSYSPPPGCRPPEDYKGPLTEGGRCPSPPPYPWAQKGDWWHARLAVSTSEEAELLAMAFLADPYSGFPNGAAVKRGVCR